MSYKKGFITTHMLTYAFGLIIILLIVFTGYVGINKFTTVSESASLTSFESKFHSDINKISSKVGSIQELKYSIPSGYKTLCMFDIDKNNSDSLILKYHPLLKLSLESKQDNIFLIGNNKIHQFKDDTVRKKLYPYYTCHEIHNGKLTIRMKGGVVDGISSAVIPIKEYEEILIDTNPIDTNEVLTSPDSKAYINLEKGTLITFPNGENKLRIQIIKGRVNEEDYKITPTGTTFDKPITIYIKDNKLCQFYEENENHLLNNNINLQSTECVRGWMKFSTNKI